MKRTSGAEIDNYLKDLSENLSSRIRELLNKKSFSAKIDARDALVSMGTSILPQMNKLLSTNDEILRREVAKIMESQLKMCE